MASDSEIDFLKERMLELEELYGDDFSKNFKQAYEELQKLKERNKKAEGGRVDFKYGSPFSNYWSTVTEMYIKSGGRKKTGMDINEFAEMYFPREKKNLGGRINYGEGTKPKPMPKSEQWMRDYFFSGKGGYDNYMSYDQFAQGIGQELYKKLADN